MLIPWLVFLDDIDQLPRGLWVSVDVTGSCGQIGVTSQHQNGFTGVNSRNNLFDEIDQTALVAGGKRQNDDINPLGGESCLQRWQDLGGSFREGRDQDKTGIFTHATEPNFGSSLPSA